MNREIRYYNLPQPLIEEQKIHPLTRGLYLTAIGELIVGQGEIWDSGFQNDITLLYCKKGEGIIQESGSQIPIKSEQYFISPSKNSFKFYSVLNTDSHLLIAIFNGKNSKIMSNHFSVVRNLVPSVNNMVANREMLFDEIFNNLSKRYHDENLEYINFCFGHLLATFIYANRTSDDLADESNTVIRQTIDFMGKNLNKKLTLLHIAKEAGYSPTYFTTLFRRETGYPPLSYFSHLKILKACEFLDHTNLKIKEISFELGYSDPYYFSKDFSRKMGLSPRQYRYRIPSHHEKAVKNI